MQIAHALFTQGFGTRRECEGLVLAGFVNVGGRPVDDPREDVDTEGLVLTVRGEPWPFHAKALVVLNKPADYECSLKPKHHASVYSLLPPPLRRRGVQAVGRLDEDTTGLLLFTDDGPLIHKLTSPRHHVPKVYEVRCRHAVSDEQLAQLKAGVTLVDEPGQLVRAADCVRIGSHTVELTLTEGKYHQVKRMLAAAGNRVDALHRSRYGHLELGSLAPGQWRWLSGPQAIVPELGL